jgi:peroxiredoxin
MADFNEKKIKIIGASVDSLEDAQQMIDRHKLTFQMAYGMNARDFAQRTGAFFDDGKGFLHATGFILRPDGKIANAVYSTGPLGRLTAADSLALIEYRSKNPG